MTTLETQKITQEMAYKLSEIQTWVIGINNKTDFTASFHINAGINVSVIISTENGNVFYHQEVPLFRRDPTKKLNSMSTFCYELQKDAREIPWPNVESKNPHASKLRQG